MSSPQILKWLCAFTLASAAGCSTDALSPTATPTPGGPTTVYVLRHAEEGPDPGDGDPSLSTEGEDRADALRTDLNSVTLAAIFASELRRTQQTVTPLATNKGVSIRVLPASSTAALAQRLLEDFPGQNVVACGHSNTVPDLLDALGVATSITLGANDYGDLFVVTLDPDTGVSMDPQTYGN